MSVFLSKLFIILHHMKKYNVDTYINKSHLQNGITKMAKSGWEPKLLTQSQYGYTIIFVKDDYEKNIIKIKEESITLEDLN